jgi:hypothetical protein
MMKKTGGNKVNDLLKQRCELFVKNRDIMKENFKWENSMMFPLCASIYTERGLEMNPDKMKLCKEIIKSNTGIFSSFKGIPFMALVTLLSLEDNPESKFTEVLKIYDILRNEFHSSPYLPLSAFVISYISENDKYVMVTQKSKDIYMKMKNEHPFLTSSEDCGYAVLTALSNIQPDEAINEMEKCYDILKGNFFSANAVQSLSHILTLGEESSIDKCNKTINIFNQLKERNCKFGSGVELSVLGLLAITAEDIDATIDEIVEVNEYLSSIKGFGTFGIGKTQRIMYSAILVSQENKKQFSELAMNIAAVNSITNLIIAQQAAMTAVIASSAAAASSNSN